MSNINLSHVNGLFDHYHKKVKKQPTLYRSGNTVTVVLPPELHDYSNAAAGHSGFKAGARPVGISVRSDNPEQLLRDIFASPESLAKFILSSECDGPSYAAAARASYGIVGAKKDNLPASTEFHNRYEYAVIKYLAEVHGRQTVKEAYDSLTIGEFELRFGLNAQVAASIVSKQADNA